MEASEKPHINPEKSTVRPIGSRLVIEHLEVDDERSSRVVRERIEAGHSGEETVRDAIEIGARVLEREGLAAEVDYVQREFERTSGQVREQFSEQAKSLTDTVQAELQRVFGDEGGVMAEALDDHADELAKQITRHFGDESSEAVQHRVRELVERSMRESRESLIRHLSSEDGSNPLADFKLSVNTTVRDAVRALKEEEKATREKLEKVQQDVVRLTEQTEAKKILTASEEAGTRKGLDFEERVHKAIEGIASGRGDAALGVGHQSGAGGSKKGDVVVEVGGADGPAQGRFVVEVKDSQLTKPKAWAELKGAMEARDAAFAILVVAGEANIPAGQSELHEYEGNKLIVAVDPQSPADRSLELAYRYARCKVILAREGELTLDAAGVRDATTEAMAALEEARNIRSALTTASKSVDRARTGVDALVDSVLEKLERIESLVGEAGDGD